MTSFLEWGFDRVLGILYVAFEVAISSLPEFSLLDTVTFPVTPQLRSWINFFVPFDLALPIFLGWVGLVISSVVIMAALRLFGILK